MNKLIHYLAIAAACGVAGTLGTSLLLADTPPAKPAEKLAPVKVTDSKVEMKNAVKPKELSAAVKSGLAYLLKNQQEDGGWNQGGGWRTSVGDKGGGRVEGKTIEDPSDVGNTCITLLALIRAGHTPVEGEYKDAVTKGLKYLLGRIEKSDSESLYVTDVRNTQLQSKIGSYVDTFLANLVLAELKGKAGTEEKRLIAALEKTMNKIVRNQTADGGFANNGGWAPTLSVGIANKSIARAKQNGVEVDAKVLDRALAQSKGAAAGTGAMPGVPAGGFAKGGPAAPPGAGLAGFGGMPAGGLSGGGFGGGGGDAGVRLYSQGQGAGNSQDIVNSLRVDAEKAKKVLDDAKAPKEEKEAAQKKLDTLKRAEADNGKIQEDLAKDVRRDGFVAGFGSNGGEEFLSFLNISEAMLIKGGKDWEEWDAKMTKGLEKAQDKDGSWAGQHCITGQTFCTAAALLVLMADRTPFPADVLKASAEKKPAAPKPPEEKK